MASTQAKPAGGLRERKKAKLRQQIMDTTLRLCRERGYENTTIEEIVRIVEISQPTFYNYFASKDAVLREFARELLLGIAQHRVDTGADDRSAEGRLRAHFEGMADFMQLDHPLWRAIVLADGFNGARAPEQREASATASRQLECIIAEGQERGEFTKDISAARLTANLDAIQGLACLQWGEVPNPDFSLQERLAEGLEFFLRAARA